MWLPRTAVLRGDRHGAAAGSAPTPLQHNCSGKHAGFLAWCRQHGQPLDSYLDPGHPLQQAIRRRLAALLDVDDESMPVGIDGCGAPNYALPLARLAHAYARLATHAPGSGHAAELDTLYGAMSAHPAMISGEARDDLILAQAAPGDWVAKGGADGVQALGIRGRGLGIALKITDGNRRALQTAVAALIGQLDLLPAGWRAAAGRMAGGRDPQLRGAADGTVGQRVPARSRAVTQRWNRSIACSRIPQCHSAKAGIHARQDPPGSAFAG